MKAAKALKEKGETPEELLRSIKENEEAVAEAQRVVDAWKAIVGEKTRREEASKAEAERIAAEKAEEEARVEAERKAEEERKAKEEERKERDENGQPFVVSSDGTTTFGEITEDTGLTAAPIKLSEGFQDANTGKGYGLVHIEANHGEQIRQAGFTSVKEFVSFVATHYDPDNIRVGKRRDDGSDTFLIQVTDTHDNTLFIELSKDGSYWNVNSGGIFRKGYSNKKETVAKTEPQQPTNAVSSDSSLSANVKDGITNAEPNGEPTVSLDKGTTLPADQQTSDKENTKKVADSEGENTLKAKIEAASADVNTEPTEAQKEAGNYKKGHVQVGAFDITIEQPEGSIRRGTDADGKKWESKMHNTYGYFRGTEGVDGDHIDVFLSNDIDGWNGRKVFVVDQYNPDGTFDEHKVMLGFNDMDEAKSDYLANYEKGWENGRRIDISSTNLEDFEKWIGSSHRKTKPFSEYSSVNKETVATDKGSKKAEKKQKKQSVFDKAKEIADKEEKKRKAEAEDDSVIGQATRAVGKKKKVNLFKYTASEKNSNSALRGVHYANGYAYASDGYILFKEKADYPKEWEGTTRDKDGNLIDGKYPDTEKAILRFVHIPDKEVESLPSKEVLDFAIAASKKLKVESIPVAIDGLFFNAVNLKKFLEAVASKGVDKVVYRHPMLYATNGKDEIVLMPTVNTLEGALDIADRMESAGLPKEQIDAWKAHIEAADKKMSFEDFKKAVENAKKEGVRHTEAEKPKEQPLTEAERKDAEEVAGALGYRVEWVDTMEENGTIDADKKVIRIAKDAENPLVQVLGHEVAHGVRRMIGGKFRTLQKAAMEVVGEKEWNERIEKKRKLNAYAEGKLAEEVTCDIVGEALNDKDALKRLAESLRGERGILARLRDAVVRMVEYFKSRGDKEGVRRMKAADKLLAEFESALKEGVAPEQVKPEDVERSVRENRSEKTELTAEERELRDNLVERMRKGGLDVVTDSEEMQRVIDTENERTRMTGAKQKRALETATIAAEATNNATVISSADGAKIQNNLGTLATNYEKIANKTRGFITDLSQALGLKRHESSQYGTFETPDGKRITIRVSNHNARVSNFDKNNESEGISIVISSHKNKGLLNDGNAHIIEYFYPKRALENAEGKPLAEMIRSVSDALAGEEFKDTTGLAEREEVNAGSVREHRVYHGSGADFDAFDHSHMGEGEGAQAYGWGTYVTEVEGIGKTYANATAHNYNKALRPLERKRDSIRNSLRIEALELDSARGGLRVAVKAKAKAEENYEEFLKRREEIEEKYGKHSTQYDDYLWNSPYAIAVRAIEHYENEIKERETELHSLQKDLEETRKQIENIAKEYPHHLYTVEIPDDNGSNYLDWNGHPAESLLKDVGSFLESDGFERVQDSPVRYEKGESTVVLNPNATGADLYAELREALGSDKKASQALAELGCIGIKYPADNMRGGREDGAKNYVIFNENDAKITDHTRFLRTADGEVYGLVKDGRIYLDPKVATAETAVHEYTHLWGDMLRRKDSEQWSHTVKELKNSVLWEEVKELYPELKTDDEIADEVLSTFSGRRGAERLREEARRVADGEGGVFTKAKAIETLERVKEAIARFWEGVARMFGINRYRSAEELADMAMRDLINGVKPTSRTFTFDNFYKDTKAVFEGTERPKGKPDYTSYSGSEYWYGEDIGGKYVVRGSDHWSGEFKVKDGERTNVGRNHYSEITEDGMLPIGAQGSLKFGWEKGLSKPVGSGISAAIDRRGSGDSNNIASCYWYIDNAKGKDNKGFTYGKAYLSEFEDKERRRDIPGDDWRDIQGLEGGTRNMFVGERGATEADKAEEVSTRLDNLSVARRMEEAKKDAKAIKMATGWERGTDGKWRYETGDAKIKDTIELDGKTFKRYDEDMLWTSGKFGDVVDAPELFKAYPELRDVRIETDAVLNDMPSNGEYNPRTNTITIHSDDLKYQNSILNHEIQHAIQHIEGFETGGSAENVRERIQQIIDNSSDEVGYARERLREWADLNAMAAMLDVAYRKFVGSGNEWERAKAVEIYWDAINTIEDNDKAELAINYPHDKTPREVAESGYLVDDVIRELNRLADETRKEIPDGNIDTMRKVDRLVGALKDKTDFELYNRLAGEVEARNTEKRIGMTEEERRASLASETEDVAREDQILLRQGLDGINIMRSEAAATPLKGDEALTALDSIFGENEGSAIPPKISSFAKFKNLFKKPVRTFLGELVQVKDEVWNKILRNNRQDITGTVLPTIENADFAIRDTDGSTLYVKRFKGNGQERMYNVVVVNKHGEVEDYISSVHIKRDNNLRNKIKKGAELFLPNARTTDGTMSRNNSTPGAKVANYSETAKPRYSRKPGESIFDYASRVSEDVDRSVRERVSARDEYEKKVKSKGFQTKEALQNSMLGLQEFMYAIDHASGNKRYIEDIPDFENPILGENRLSSVNKEEMHQVAKTQFKPLMSAVAKLSGNGKESGELYDYMFAKHGLERDAVMRQREAQKEFDKYQKANPKGTKTIGDFVASLEGKDYAGLTALTAEDGRVKSIQSQIDAIDEQMEVTDNQLLLHYLGGQKKRLKVDLLNAARDAADDIRKTFENNPSHDRSDINELWKRVNEVNGNTLRKLYESGMLTKEAYNDISSMYTNYIPMRGFDQTTSADAYAYLTHGDSAFNAPIKTAKGRSSKADNPIAYMQAMAESAIMQGNRNVLVKQKMLNFVRNHPSDLASVSDVWLQYDSVADEWKPVFPDNIGANDSASVVAKKMEAFEDKMDSRWKSIANRPKRKGSRPD